MHRGHIGVRGELRGAQKRKKEPPPASKREGGYPVDIHSPWPKKRVFGPFSIAKKSFFLLYGSQASLRKDPPPLTHRGPGGYDTATQYAVSGAHSRCTPTSPCTHRHTRTEREKNGHCQCACQLMHPSSHFLVHRLTADQTSARTPFRKAPK